MILFDPGKNKILNSASDMEVSREFRPRLPHFSAARVSDPASGNDDREKARDERRLNVKLPQIGF